MNNENLTIGYLEILRLIGDVNADSFIKQVISSYELPYLNSFFKKLIYNNQFNSDDIPAEFKDYINANSQLPSWADSSKIELAQQAFARIGPSFILSYFCKSLPECYACGKGAEVLYDTGRLTNHTRRRIALTAQFVLDVMSPGGLEPTGRGIATSLKVRLLHASIRFYLLREVDKGTINYNVETNGYPINQEDLMGTMLAFSTVVIEGMDTLGFSVSAEEKEAIVHLWKCTGFLIGIDENNMPADYNSSIILWNAISTSLDEKTQAGIILTKDLTDFLDEILHDRILKDVVPILMYALMGDKTCKLLEVRPPKYFNPIAFLTLILGILLLKFESKGIMAKIASHYINLKLLNALEKYIAKGEDTGLYIPPGLRKDWQIDNPITSLFSVWSK